MGALGLPIFVGLRGMTETEVVGALEDYRSAWREAGYPGDGDVILRIPVYVARDMEKALSEPQNSTLHSYARLRLSFVNSAGRAGTTADEERSVRAQRLGTVTYEDLLRDRLAYGTPGVVAQRLGQLRDELGLSGVVIEANSGGRMPIDQVNSSVRLFAQEVAPELRAHAISG